MTTVVTLQVVCRYLLGAALPWSEELARYFLVWMTFLGASIALKREAHMGIQGLVDKLSSRVQRSVKLLTRLTVFGFLCIATLKGFQLALFNMNQYSPAMRIPMGMVYFAIPTGCLIMLAHLAEQMSGLFKNWPVANDGGNR
jgi:TRAP-type C4-dicarboxylate transport system permease small subunit